MTAPSEGKPWAAHVTDQSGRKSRCLPPHSPVRRIRPDAEALTCWHWAPLLPCGFPSFPYSPHPSRNGVRSREQSLTFLRHPKVTHHRIPVGSGSSCPMREGIGAFPIPSCSQLLCIPDSGGKGKKAVSSHLINSPLFAPSSILAPSIVPAHNYSNLRQ